MPFDCRDGEPELECDLLVGRTRRHLPENLQLSRGKAVGCRATDAGWFTLGVRRIVCLATPQKPIDSGNGLIVDAARDRVIVDDQELSTPKT